MLTDQELQSLRNLGNDAEAAADEIVRLRRVVEAVNMRDAPLLTAAPKLEQALRELVELEDMRLRLRQLHEMGHGTDYADYHRLLPLAWAAAREALGPNVGVEPPYSVGSND